MKGYEEFKGYRTRVVYDPDTKTFMSRKLAAAAPPAKAKKAKRAARKRQAPQKSAEPVRIPMHAAAP